MKQGTQFGRLFCLLIHLLSYQRKLWLSSLSAFSQLLHLTWLCLNRFLHLTWLSSLSATLVLFSPVFSSWCPILRTFCELPTSILFFTSCTPSALLLPKIPKSLQDYSHHHHRKHHCRSKCSVWRTRFCCRTNEPRAMGIFVFGTLNLRAIEPSDKRTFRLRADPDHHNNLARESSCVVLAGRDSIAAHQRVVIWSAIYWCWIF